LKQPFALPLLLVVCFAPGCASLPSPPVRPAVYDFGPGALTTSTATRPTLPPIVLQEVKAPPALDSAAVPYRLAYSDPQQLRPYAHARWSMPPAQLVQQRLRESLSLTRAVVSPGESDVPLALRVELHEFSQLFDTPQASSGLVRLRATLIEIKGGADRLVAQQVFVVQRPAASADAPGGVRALMAATDAAIEEIGAWLQRQPTK
jgi:cholesterol transport system auxiliary component